MSEADTRYEHEQWDGMFIDYLQEHYNCDLGRFSHAHNISHDHLREILQGRQAVDCAPGVVQRLIDISGAKIKILFPPGVYLYKQFDSILDAPGYSLLAKKLKLSSSRQNRLRHPSLWTRFEEAKMTKSEYNPFCNVLQGCYSPRRCRSMLMRALDNLQIGGTRLDEVFPPSLYQNIAAELWAFTKAQKRPKWKNDLIQEKKEARRRLREVSAPAVLLQLSREEMVDELWGILHFLNPQDREVLALRYGFDGEEPHTLGEAALRLGVARQRVYQREERALKKLHRYGWMQDIFVEIHADEDTADRVYVG